MPNLWLAIIIYSVGLAVVLYIRPQLMFMESGAWKEFGYKRDVRHTIFPFWLFSIVWAVASYALAAAFGFSATALTTTAAISSGNYDGWIPASQQMEEEMEMEEAVPVKRPRGRPRKTPRPGYYVLEEDNSGLRRYVYYGETEPASQ